MSASVASDHKPDSVAARILVVDDDAELCKLVSRFLGAEGYSVYTVHTGGLGVERVMTENYDLVVLDVMLPELDGFEVLRRIRIKSATPILMLTARGDDLDRILGLEMGADDYLPNRSTLVNSPPVFGPSCVEQLLRIRLSPLRSRICAIGRSGVERRS